MGETRPTVNEAESGSKDTADLTKYDDNLPTEAVFFHDTIYKYLDHCKLSKDTNEPAHEIMALLVLRKLILQTRMRRHPVGLDV